MPHKQAQILLIDDDASTREYVWQKLKGHFFINTFESWTQAISSLDGCDLLLLDVQLKGLKGGEIARLLRERYDLKRDQNPPAIVLFSGLDAPDLAKLQRTCQADAYLVKDFSKNLVSQVTSLLRSLRPKALENKSPPVTDSQASSLEQESTETLLTLLTQGNFLKRAGAAFVLGQRPEDDQRVQEALQHSLKDNKSVVRNAARLALKKIEERRQS